MISTKNIKNLQHRGCVKYTWFVSLHSMKKCVKEESKALNFCFVLIYGIQFQECQFNQ